MIFNARNRIITFIMLLLGWLVIVPIHNYAENQKDPELISIALDTNIILIGDQIHFTLSAAIPKNKAVILPDFNDTIIGSIEIIEKFSPDTMVRNDGLLQVTHDYIITSFDTGIHIIPPMDIRYVENDFDDVITSDPLGLLVLGFAIDTTKGIFDIKPPIDTPLSWNEIKPYVLILIIAILVLVLIALFIYYIITKRRNIPFFGRKKPKLPPHEEAFKQLEKIWKSKLYQAGKIKQYYTEVTDVLRVYLEGRLGIQTMEKTSKEILDDVKETNEFETGQIKSLDNLLYSADMVKFAKNRPLPNECERFYKTVYALVDETKYIEEENTEKETDKNA